MDWGKLQTFIALARSGNLARAGRMLGLDATTISRKIRALEGELGETLFKQTREGQILTAEGRRLLTHAEAMERAAFNFVERGTDDGVERGLLRVAVTEGFGTRFIAPRIGAFVARFPRIAVDLFANSGFLSPSRKEADIAILLARPRKGPLKTRKLTDYALGLYAVKDGDADALPVVSYIPDVIYAPELDYLAEMAPGRASTIRSSSINAQAQMIATGAGVGVLPCFMGDSDARLRRIQPELTIRRTFWLAVHQDVSLLPRVRCFADWLVDVVAAERPLLLGL